MTTIIDTRAWSKDGVWAVAPAGLTWIKEGTRIICGARAIIGEGASGAVDLGWADGYRKCIAGVKGVAYIGAGYRWFTLDAAIKHWSGKNDRVLTMCLMQSAVAIAGYNDWDSGASE